VPFKIFFKKKKSLQTNIFYLTQKSRKPILRLNKMLKNRLGSLEVKTFWGSFIKKGVRPLKTYFYVFKKIKIAS
jgi:hypothetical protein